MPLPASRRRLGLLLTPCLLGSLLGTPSLAANVWSWGDAPGGPAVYAPADVLAVPAPQARRPGDIARIAAMSAAPDFNRWAGGPGAGARTGGFPFFCGNALFSFGARGGPWSGPGRGFSFGPFN